MALFVAGGSYSQQLEIVSSGHRRPSYRRFKSLYRLAVVKWRGNVQQAYSFPGIRQSPAVI